MFNTDNTVPNWEKPEGANAENQELSANAEAWNNTFPKEEAENPWLNANMEAPLDSTNNIVTEQTQEIWNNGEGGKSIEAAYDDLRGNYTAEDIKNSADQVEPGIADVLNENADKGDDSGVDLPINNNLNPEEVPIAQQAQAQEAPIAQQAQAQEDLYNLTASASATAIGAQAGTEQAIVQLQSNNDVSELDSAEKDLNEAQQTLQDIQSEMSATAPQLNQDPLALQTAEDALHEAQDMVTGAENSLAETKIEAEKRQEFIDNHQEEISNLQEQGVTNEEINQSISETGDIQNLQEENNQSPLPEIDEDDQRVSIFG